jgi:ribosome-associated toxin RatA of RatAB toxin-antitoxin module
MDVSAVLAAQVDPELLFDLVADLARYPDWLEIVPRAQAVEPDPSDAGPAWSVDLRGQLGLLSRSKRLRMVRTQSDSPRIARFERRELDSRSHSDWVLEARVEALSAVESTLTMSLHYGGTMWVPMLDRLLADEIERSRGRLLSVLGVNS